jgi:hypothetical protein
VLGWPRRFGSLANLVCAGLWSASGGWWVVGFRGVLLLGREALLRGARVWRAPAAGLADDAACHDLRRAWLGWPVCSPVGLAAWVGFTLAGGSGPVLQPAGLRWLVG